MYALPHWTEERLMKIREAERRTYYTREAAGRAALSMWEVHSTE